MKREKTNQLIRVGDQISHANKCLDAARKKAQRWETRVTQLKEEELKLRIAHQLPLGSSTKKNAAKQSVWYSVAEILGDPIRQAGLTTSELFEVVREEHRRLNIITFRAYIREFSSSDRSLLVKQGDRWNLPGVVKQLQERKRI